VLSSAVTKRQRFINREENEFMKDTDDDTFETELLRPYFEGDFSDSSIALEFGMDEQTIARWRSEYAANK
jgi:hypothetical protein